MPRPASDLYLTSLLALVIYSENAPGLVSEIPACIEPLIIFKPSLNSDEKLFEKNFSCPRNLTFSLIFVSLTISFIAFVNFLESIFLPSKRASAISSKCLSNFSGAASYICLNDFLPSLVKSPSAPSNELKILTIVLRTFCLPVPSALV